MARGAGERGSILVADADEGFRRDTSRALSDAGFEVVGATSGEEALAAVLRDDVVLAVLEVRLPGISGYEVCRRLREEHGDRVPIVFVSGDRVESSDRVAGLLVGADDYLVKPVAQDEIVARVRRQLERAPGRSSPSSPRLTRGNARSSACSRRGSRRPRSPEPSRSAHGRWRRTSSTSTRSWASTPAPRPSPRRSGWRSWTEPDG